MGLDRALPRAELFHRQLVAAANFFETDGALAHRLNDHCLAPWDPTFGRGRRQVDVGCELRQVPVLCRIPGRYAFAHDINLGFHVWEERDHHFQRRA